MVQCPSSCGIKSAVAQCPICYGKVPKQLWYIVQCAMVLCPICYGMYSVHYAETVSKQLCYMHIVSVANVQCPSWYGNCPMAQCPSCCGVIYNQLWHSVMTFCPISCDTVSKPVWNSPISQGSVQTAMVQCPISNVKSVQATMILCPS